MGDNDSDVSAFNSIIDVTKTIYHNFHFSIMAIVI